VITVQALNVVLTPNFSGHTLATNGSATPDTLFAAHMIPYASPFRCANHWSRYSVVGLNTSPLPMAQSTPCVAIRCQTYTENDESSDPATVRTRPTTAQCLCAWG
jgi:hypothetical protein